MMALPMPKREKAVSMMAKDSPKRGKRRDTAVTTRERSTVFLRPILFISMPVGTLNSRNQKNTSEGKMFATESESWRSDLT